jgi:hypothetical protein
MILPPLTPWEWVAIIALLLGATVSVIRKNSDAFGDAILLVILIGIAKFVLLVSGH